MSDASPAALEVIGLGKRFGSFTALEDVSMRIRSGGISLVL